MNFFPNFQFHLHVHNERENEVPLEYSTTTTTRNIGSSTEESSSNPLLTSFYQLLRNYSTNNNDLNDLHFYVSMPTPSPPPQQRGLTMTELRQTTSLISVHSETQCTICHNTMETNMVVRKLEGCGHFFHIACIDEWFERHSTCPVCRRNLLETPPSND